MSLIDRSGSELTEVEKALIFEEKYANTGFVQYDTKNGESFFLHPSPFLNTPKREIYHISGSPPPEHQFVEVGIVNEQQEFLGNSEEKWINVKEVGQWKPFDPSPLAAKRKIMDFREVIEFFTYPYKGEMESVQEIAGCSSLFAVSTPPGENYGGGINSAVLGKDLQWDLFNKSLEVIPHELRKPKSNYYYYISKIEKRISKDFGEKNIAILRPKKLLSDIPVIIVDESPKRISKDLQAQIDIESKIITAYLLDALLLKPRVTKQIEKMLLNEIYRMREECLSVELMPFNQNLAAIPKLAAAYCRLQSNPEIRSEDVHFVADLWFSAQRKAGKFDSSSMKTNHMLELTGDALRVFMKLEDIFGIDNEISMAEAVREMKMDPRELELAMDSIEFKGYCTRKEKSFTLLDLFKKQNLN